MAARLLGCVRHLTAFLEILHSVRDDGQVSYFTPGRKQRTIQVDIAGTVESVARGKAVNCSPVIYLLRSGAHRLLLRYKAILFTDLTEKFRILSPTGLGVFSVFLITSAT